ncbi:MAG: 1-hydroxy-2-methyl-2-(E)-butenyl 4-diphosphate synthase, partial [Chitinophagia bacterium]|nr:1-hydroxy-2-methyl-2-(E)-butenyl 4-diphosphate synthase [Chitinophagia bacterium]
EIPVCLDLVKRYNNRKESSEEAESIKLPYSPFEYKRRVSTAVENIGAKQVPVVVANFKYADQLIPAQLHSIGYDYDEATDKWKISDAAADFIYTGNQPLSFALPGTLKNIVDAEVWDKDAVSQFPLFDLDGYLNTANKSSRLNFVLLDEHASLLKLKEEKNIVLCVKSDAENAMQSVRKVFVELASLGITHPVVLYTDSNKHTPDEHLIHLATETGALLLDGMGDGICLGFRKGAQLENPKVKGRTYLPVKDIYQFANNTAFSILQATRTRISKTEYISCPSCGRTLFDLQETTAKIRAVTNHLKGVKIAIMGCIVNGPGEMADADFGYVGSGPGKITLYRSKEIVKKNVDSEIAVDELINLLKESGAWLEPS